MNLSVSVLGPFAAELDGAPLPPFRTRSVQALLVYLLCEAGRPHTREALMTLLWPGMPQASAQANLRQTLYRLRKHVSEVSSRDGAGTVPLVLADRQHLQVNPEAAYRFDVDLLRSREPAAAIELYRGDFLEDFYLPDSDAFETWAAGRRAAFRQLALDLLESQAARHLAEGDYSAAVQLAERQLALDNLHENAHRQWMEARARAGRPQEALVHYNQLTQLLKEELDLAPAPETRQLAADIRAGNMQAARHTESAEPEAAREERPKHNLPERLASFIGRDKELATIRNLLEQHRLVMLTGTGGIGKTNLCLQVGHDVLAEYPDGVWLIELAPVADPELVPQTAAQALGLREIQESSTFSRAASGTTALPEQPELQKTLDYLKKKTCLLIIDNCEHVIDAAAQLVESILEACPHVKIISSSREALGILGEMPYRVPPLSTPARHMHLAADEWQQFDALQLFVTRASAVMPSFKVTEENLLDMIQICRRLDGIPLAIELAAARVNMLTVAEIAARLDDRFRLLTGGSRTALPRQQTLRALVDWSWDLLEEEEKLLLQRLSVFMGGMGLPAIEAICADERLEANAILDHLGELVNKSLVIPQRSTGAPSRYLLLETIRQYAQEQLASAGQSAALRDRHLDYFLRWTAPAEAGLAGPKQVEWYQKIEQELDNLRAALSWASETNPQKGLQLMISTAAFWDFVQFVEGIEWLSQLLGAPEDIEPAILARAYLLYATLTFTLGRFEPSRALLEKALPLFESLGDEQGTGFTKAFLAWFDGSEEWERRGLEYCDLCRRRGDKDELANTLEWLANIALEKNQFDQAEAYLLEAEALFRETGNLAGLAEVLRNLARNSMYLKQFDRAIKLLEESQQYLGSASPRTEAMILEYFGQLYFFMKDFARSRTYLEKALQVSDQYGRNFLDNWAVVRMGYIMLYEEQPDHARRYLVESLERFNTLRGGMHIGSIYALEGFARLALRQGQPERALRLYAWADAARVVVSDPRPPVESTDVENDMDAIRDTLSEDAYSTVYAEGQAMDLEAVIAYAFEDGNG